MDDVGSFYLALTAVSIAGIIARTAGNVATLGISALLGIVLLFPPLEPPVPRKEHR